MRYVSTSVEEILRDGKMAFVAGPRQVGKTTLAKSLRRDPAGSYFTWDLDSHRRRIIRAREQFWPVPAGAGRARIVLDEIHKYPRWKRFLKGLFDTRRDDLEIIVVGSGRLSTS